MASFDAAAAEFAGKALGTFWTLFFAASVAADLDLLPGVSARLRLFAARGKQADAEPSSPSAPADPRAASKWWVPHAWFAHFYVVGIACNAFVLAHALAVEPISAEHAAATLASCLFQAHVARRFLETAFIARHREGARMHLAGYLVGVFYYVAAPVTFATPETTRAVCETVRVALAKALAEAARASGSASGGDEAPTRFFFASPRFAPPRFGAAVRSSLSLTARSVSSALAGAPVSLARVARVAAGAAAFALGSAKQARCHRLLARLRETPRATATRATRAEDRSGTRLYSGTKLDTSNQSNTSIRQTRDVGRRLYTNKTHYAVPRGDWFEVVSSPHYLAECVLYAGLALVAGARAFPRLAPMLAAVGANLALAARRTHAWYLETFPEYPKNRWAMVPGVL